MKAFVLTFLIVTSISLLATEESESPRPLSKSEQKLRTPPPSDDSTGIIALAPGIEPPNEETSSTEKFLYALASATASYCLDAAYRPSYVGFADTVWALDRAIAVKELVESRDGSNVPPALRNFCQEALLLDAHLQVIGRAADNAMTRAKEEARDLLIDRARNLSRTFDAGNGDTVEESLTKNFLNAWARATQIDYLINSLVEQKRRGDYHRKWGALLNRLASTDAALRPYARDPRITDPTWHFLRGSTAGDVFFGQSYSDRARVHFEIDRTPHRKVSAGSLEKGPIEIKISGRGTFVYDVAVDLPAGRDRPILMGACSRGQFGFFCGDEFAWVARGLSDSKHRGKIDFSDAKYWRGGKASVTVMHFLTTGKGEDLEADGSLLIYLGSQAASDAEARQLARRVNL
jgi:hypothetical protein